MKGKITIGTLGLPAFKDKVSVYLVKYAKKTDVLKKFC